MAEYIEKSVAIARVTALEVGNSCALMEDIVRAIADTPAADVVPVVHGRWLLTDAYPHRLFCSVCYKTACPNVEFMERWEMHFMSCPHCRAIMDEEPDHDTDGNV